MTAAAAINNVQFKTAAILFGGIGGESSGLLESMQEYGGKVYKFKILCSIDSDPIACHNHDLITGGQTSVVMDLFRRWQYKAWHGHEPPAEWREMTTWDIWQAFKEQVPFFLFTSPPCKGLSGLLPQATSESDKYQALNYLTISGLELSLEACVEFGGAIPAIIQLENVPRITSRGKPLLQKIKKLLKKFGYEVSIRADHNLGEIGGLGQNRVRFLIMARDPKQIPNFIYYPEKKPLRTIGDVLGPLPAPGDTEAGGPLNKLPKLHWKTWMRLALIPAGGDWRDLNKVDYQNLRVVHEPRAGAYGVAEWNKACGAVTSTAGPGRSNGVSAVADPRLRLGERGKTNILRVQPAGRTGMCVTGVPGPFQGGACIADPELSERPGRHPAQYRIVHVDETAPCVTGSRIGSGGIAIADPRVGTSLMPDSYGIQDWDAAAKTVRSANRIMQSAGSVADPRIAERLGRYTDKFRMQSADVPAATVTGVTDVQSGAQLIADPSYKCSPRADTLGVQEWESAAKTVIGSADVHAGAAAVADPRPIPADNDRGVWIIRTLDGTWHRPLTTFELAMLQSFPQYLPDGRPFQLEGCSDAKAREYIGNAVPRDAAEQMGNVILLAGAMAEAQETFRLSWDEVWVAPAEMQWPEVVH
ncbi:DNA cytosine methyltransferase [Cohnella thailandensis]|uniref:DNA cytosine methyltransferase n=1 Tax=Cohnella thailandensis TaxID=557557 RepID=A0A841SPP1_9BACL|nr:DNA cytosine methyltransferase [Cohnella thailandensis]MBB6632789.1 DNA cytosine methyltransferase [Cohnella thailandensis]MBP1975520.1 site-specific DNA-cytosine methylase [Cohnella thailandensis]